MVKERADHQRIYDNDGYKKRAACVCVKNENENEVIKNKLH
jgi:diphosphoinositol-polyphosphate diphosphatase